ncbi:MAG: hypothetical protein HY241_06125 [Actinobacteria bacterium]|nr:hypothetical protein [Actinomycetota bacterium]
MMSVNRTQGLPAQRPQLPTGVHVVTVVLGTWLMVGAFVDAWAHNNLAQLETFFTPWHGLLYSGFAASAGWIGWQVWRHQPRGGWDRTRVPAGYGLGLAGAGLFLLGGLGDMTWHVLLGIEVGIDALYSPTHLMLFGGVFLVLTTVLRSAWWNGELGRDPGYRRLLPALCSITLASAAVAFFFQYWSVQRTAPHALARWSSPAGQDLAMQGLASILVTNLILVGAVLYLSRRWIVPLGTATTLYTTVGLMLGLASQYAFPGALAGLVASGLVADLVLAVVRPDPDGRGRTWLAGALVPAVTWTTYLAVVAVTSGVTWPAELSSGVVVWAALSGLALAVLMVPTRPAASHGPRPA